MARTARGCGGLSLFCRSIQRTERRVDLIAKKANSLTLEHRAVVAGTLGTWSPEAEALTREALWLAEQGGRGRRYDGYSGLARCPYLLKALGRYGPGAKAAVPELRELLHAPRPLCPSRGC